MDFKELSTKFKINDFKRSASTSQIHLLPLGDLFSSSFIFYFQWYHLSFPEIFLS